MNKIIIHNMKVKTHIGATEQERRQNQSIFISIDITPSEVYTGENDTLENTIDYSSVRKDIKSLFRETSYHLIETAALVCARHIKKNYPVKTVTVLVKKFPYRDVEYVGYSITI